MVLLRSSLLSLPLWALAATPASADPITGAIAAVAGAIGVSTTALVVGTVLVGAAVVGALALRPKIPSISDQGTNLPALGPAEPYVHVIGETKVAGTVVDRHVSGDDNQWLFEARALCVGPIEAITELRINGEAVTTGALDANNGRPITNSDYVSNGTNVAYVTYGLGASGEAVDGMLRTWSTADANATHQPFAYLNMRFDLLDDIFGGQVPIMTAIAKGHKVYDPRDSNQDADDETTWTWTDNPALLAAWYVRQSWTFGSLSSEIDWPAVTTAANACDELVAITGGTEKRYRCNGWFTEADDRETVLQKIIDSMAGDYVQPKSTGKWIFLAGVYAAPVMDILESDIQKTKYSPYQPLTKRFTKLRGTYISPANQYEAMDCAPVADAAAKTEEGGAEIEDKIELDFVQSATQARRILSIILQRSRHQIGATITFDNMVGMVLIPGERVTLTDADYELSSKVMRVESVQYEDIMPVVTLREDNTAIYTAPTIVDEVVTDVSTVTTTVGPYVPSGGGGGGITINEVPQIY